MYQIKRRCFIDLNRYGLFPRFAVSAYQNNMNKPEQRSSKQQQMNKTKLNPPDTQHQLQCINSAFNTG